MRQADDLLRLPSRLSWSRICLQCGRPGFNLWFRKIPWRSKWQPTPVLLPGKFYGLRRLAGYSPWGCKESNMIERLTHTQCKYLIKGFPGG